ncbi:GNAT family N-acetyltransferase [Vaginisenegalia massiliensis]|uniref:GNAT family N-acetyltransferase n=1 Tax=Vaginisenegalia massiliensis TaxID=2058294 RepID=UPI001F14E1C0|nr:GNAT family N-acetyltransferase [Vaginisenegalia massiliensis]
MELKIGTQAYLRAAASYIRYQVFVIDGVIAPDDEFDDNDIPETCYAVMFDGKVPVATARLLDEDAKTVRITRVATLSAYRGRGLASQILQALEETAQSQGYQKVLIHSEIDALPFYLKNHYQKIGIPYYEDDQPCQSVYKDLK